MQRVLETDDLHVHPGGEIPVRHGSAVYNVRLAHEDLEQPHVEVYAVVVEDVDADPGLYEALNTINRRLSHARAFWADRKVVLAGELVGTTLDYVELACTCEEIGNAAHIEGPRLSTVYGGQVAHPDGINEEGL